MTTIAPILQITTQRPANVRTVWRVCPECQFEIGWAISQPSVTHCPYCHVEYQLANKRWPTLFRTIREVVQVGFLLFGTVMTIVLILYVITGGR